MHFDGSVVLKKRSQLFLCLYEYILRRGEEVLGKFMYELFRQRILQLSFGSESKRIRRMRDGCLLQQFRLWRGQAVCQCRDNLCVLL